MPRSLSHAAFERAQQLLPGGVNSPARAFGGVGGEPVFIARAEGAHLVDLDGNRYLDYIGSWGPMILGHGHPRVVAALEAAIRRGTSYGAPTEAESHLAPTGHRGGALDREGPPGQLGHRGHDERHPSGSRLHRAGR